MLCNKPRNASHDCSDRYRRRREAEVQTIRCVRQLESLFEKFPGYRVSHEKAVLA